MMNSERSLYTGGVDFAELASSDGEFAKVLKSNNQLDFSDPASVQQLTKSLLKRDFKLNLELPPDRLCPPVPNRLNYIIWAQNLLDTTSSSFNERYDPKRFVIVLDIGTGASAIYPLLGCTARPTWRFIGTDIDTESVSYAAKNIASNNLTSRIRLLKTSSTDPLIPLDKLGLETIDLTLSNPPFYSSPAELASSASIKSRPPNSACTGSVSEMVTPGGEVQFVTRQITASLVLLDRVQWYSSMLGKLSSLAPLVELLREHDITNYAITEFVQGSKTRRWALAWSFGDLRPDLQTCRGVKGSGVPKELLPWPSEFSFLIKVRWEVSGAMERIVDRLNGQLDVLPLKWKWKGGLNAGVGFAGGNVWSRAARRRMSRSQVTETEAKDVDEEYDMAFGFKVSLATVKGNEAVEEGEGEGVNLTIRWLKGLDSVLFESFCGMLRRKLES